jgi:hypothetical protein
MSEVLFCSVSRVELFGLAPSAQRLSNAVLAWMIVLEAQFGMAGAIFQ